MTNAQLAEWERAARALADQLCGMVNERVADNFSLHAVSADDADGTNSLDQEFVAKIERGEHLTDDFLANA